ncbi:MAG: PIN domain-containing protein [Candidatus Diapherotrites archaeon]
MRDTTEEYFCDTYALVEIAKGNPRYSRFEEAALVTLDFNLAELYYGFLRENGRTVADAVFKEYSQWSVSFPQSVIPSAMRFKLEFRRENLSYADCLGYAFAQSQGIPFLTGDRQFEGKPGVEFVR